MARATRRTSHAGLASGECCLFRRAAFHIPLLLQPGDQEICGGFRHFWADTLDVLLGHFMNGFRFHLVKFAHLPALRVHNNDLVAESLSRNRTVARAMPMLIISPGV